MRKLSTALLLAGLLWGYAFAAQISRADTLQEACAGFASRISAGVYVQVTSRALNIRSTPNVDGDTVREPLPAGTLVFIDDGPECVDNFTWWQVNVDDLQGWVAEGNADRYFLSEPVDPDRVVRNTTTGSSGEANPNPPLGTLDGSPGGGNYDYACHGAQEGVSGRDPTTQSNVGSGAQITFVPSLNMLEVDTPAICLGQGSPTNSRNIAVSSDGSLYPATMNTVFWEDGSFGFGTVQLPLEAFRQLGRWQLQVDGFSLNVDIRRPDHPYVMYTFLNGGQMLVGGLKPNERFIINGTGNEDDSTYYFEALADASGFFVTPLSQLPWFGDLWSYDTNSLYASVTRTDIVGQQGSFVSLRGVDVRDPETGWHWFNIPVRQAAPLMQQIVWGGRYDAASADNLLRSWTCPGAAPIRLNRNDSGFAGVIGQAQPIYDQPTVSARVAEMMQPGDSIFLLDGVECADNGVWWETSDGWLMESQNGQYLWAPA